MDSQNINRCISTLTDYLIECCKHITDYSLINGKLGIAVSTYSAYRKLNRKDYERVANSIVNECFDKITGISNDISFNGLSGFGYCIEHLVQDKFLSGDTDDSLADVDRFICTHIINAQTSDISFNNGILGLGFYLFKRINNKDPFDENLSLLSCEAFLKKVNEKLILIIDNLKDSVYNHCNKKSNDYINWNFYYLLLYLGLLIESKVCYENLNKIIDKSLFDLDNLFLRFSPIQKLFLFYTISVFKNHGYDYDQYCAVESSVNMLSNKDFIHEINSNKNSLFMIACLTYTYSKLYSLHNNENYLKKQYYWIEYLCDNISKTEMNGFTNYNNESCSLGILNGYAGIVYILSNLN